MKNDRTFEEVEEIATQCKSYFVHQDNAIFQFNFLLSRLDPECKKALKTLEEELLLAQGVATRNAYLLGLETCK